jgi:hypothetical protein
MADIRINVYAPGQPCETKSVAHELEVMQGIVGGYLEAVRLPIPSLIMVCNEEGLLLDLPANIMGIRGTFFVTRQGSDGDWISLTDADLVSLHGLFAMHLAPR